MPWPTRSHLLSSAPGCCGVLAGIVIAVIIPCCSQCIAWIFLCEPGSLHYIYILGICILQRVCLIHVELEGPVQHAMDTEDGVSADSGGGRHKTGGRGRGG